MAFASLDTGDDAEPLAEINMVPLIDVLLVLLVVFIVSAPLLTDTVRLRLPQASAHASDPRPDKVEFSIDATGQRHWNDEPVDRATAARRFAAEDARRPQPEIYLRADQAVACRLVAETLADASKAGLARVGFVSQPELGR